MKKSNKEELLAYLFIFPAFVIILIFHILPAFVSFRISLFSWDMIDKYKKFVGISNYIFLISDSEFLRSLLNTVYFAGIVVPVSIVISLFFAVLLNSSIRGGNVNSFV